MDRNEFYEKVFQCGQTSITRADLEELPCPFCTENITDEKMELLAGTTEATTRHELGLFGQEQYDWENESHREVWWRNLEESAIALGIPYHEDICE